MTAPKDYEAEAVSIMLRHVGSVYPAAFRAAVQDALRAAEARGREEAKKLLRNAISRADECREKAEYSAEVEREACAVVVSEMYRVTGVPELETAAGLIRSRGPAPEKPQPAGIADLEAVMRKGQEKPVDPVREAAREVVHMFSGDCVVCGASGGHDDDCEVGTLAKALETKS